MRRCPFVLVVAMVVACAGDAVAEDAVWRAPETLAVAVDTAVVESGRTRVELQRSPITEVLAVEGPQGVLEATRYRVLGPVGALSLSEPFAEATRLIVRYRYDPILLPGFAQWRVPEAVGTAARPRDRARSSAQVDSTRNVTDPGLLQIRGSKTVSVQGGTNRDAVVDQGLNLSITGRLTETIGVRAEISDENLPITPEGNTEELSDLDQVRIQLFGPRGRATLGDFRIDAPLGRFVPYQRKLQGLELVGVDARGRVKLLGGAPQGRRVEQEIFGREGVQGPYELLDVRATGTRFIVAGSERVWVNGALMTRGEDNDYTIDYVRSTVTFTSRRPIDVSSRIAIDFETSDTGYRRNVIGAQVDSLGVGSLRFGLAVLREGDDPDRPRDRSLEPEEIEALEQAGDDPEAARSAGVRRTDPGEGSYVEDFTLEGERFFVLADTTGSGKGGDFDVDFRFVGARNGEYRVRGVDVEGDLTFEYVGAGEGDYAIGRTLPLPSVTDVVVARAQWGVDETTGFVRAEWNHTAHDANRFSDLDDSDNEASAFSFEAVGPRWFGDDEHGLSVHARAERIEEDFYALGRLRAPFFYQAWNLQQDQRDVAEDFADVGAAWNGSHRTLDFGWQTLRRRGVYRGQRWTSSGSGQLVGPFHFRHALAATRADREGAGASDRDDRRLRLQWRDRGLVPFVEGRSERFEDRQLTRTRGFRSETVETGLDWTGRGRVAWSHEVADSLRAGDFSFARDVSQVRARGGVGGAGQRVDVDLTWRRTELPDDLKETTRLAVLGYDLQIPERGLALDLDYRVSNEQNRVLGREIVFVGLGEGDFDLEGNPVGVNQGDYDVVFTPTDSLVRSTEVELSSRLDVQPATDRFGGFSNVLLWQLTERSRTEDIGRLLRLDPGVLRDPDTTVFGEQRIRNELTLLRRVRRFDLRVDHERTEGLDQRFENGPEERRRRTTNARFESELVAGFSVRLDAGAETRTRESTDTTNPLRRSYEVDDLTAATSLRWRRDRSTRLGLEARWTDRSESRTPIEQTILALSPSVTSAVFGVQATVQARLAQVEESSDPNVTRPFFFERPGTQRSASIRVQWGGSGNLSVSFRFSVRDEPDRPLRQDLGVETRARF